MQLEHDIHMKRHMKRHFYIKTEIVHLTKVGNLQYIDAH